MSGVKEGNPKSLLLKAVLLFSSVDYMFGFAIIIPLMAGIFGAFPDSSQTMLNQLISLPALIMIPTVLFSGWLSKYISKKYILIAGNILFIVTGVMGAFANSLVALIVFRALSGFATGLVYPLVPSIIAHMFDGEGKAKMNGYMNSVGSVFSFVTGIIAGYLGVINWRYAFYLYAIFGIVVILQCIVLPPFPPENKDVKITQSINHAKQKPKFGRPVWLAMVAMVVFIILSFVIVYDLSIFIQDSGLGTSAQTGLATSTNTLFSILFSALFGIIYKYLKRYTSVLGLIVMAISYFLVSTANSIIMVYVGEAFGGIGMALLMPYLITRCAITAPKALKTMAVSWISMALFAGQFLAGYTTPLLGSFAGGDLRNLFILTGIILIACVVIAVVFIGVTKKSDEERIAWINAEEAESV